MNAPMCIEVFRNLNQEIEAIYHRKSEAVKNARKEVAAALPKERHRVPKPPQTYERGPDQFIRIFSESRRGVAEPQRVIREKGSRRAARKDEIDVEPANPLRPENAKILRFRRIVPLEPDVPGCP